MVMWAIHTAGTHGEAGGCVTALTYLQALACDVPSAYNTLLHFFACPSPTQSFMTHLGLLCPKEVT